MIQNFRDSQNNQISFEEIAKLIDSDSIYEVYIGTDSKVKKKDKIVNYATCIILYKKGKGGKIFIKKDKKSLSSSLRERLTNEVWKSLETSMELSKFLPKNSEIIIHIDANKSPRHKSGNYSQELAALVSGQGFKFKLKPDAFAAQSVADKFVKKGDVS